MCLICGSMSVPAGREESGRSPGRYRRIRRSRRRRFWRSIRSQVLTLAISARPPLLVPPTGTESAADAELPSDSPAKQLLVVLSVCPASGEVETGMTSTSAARVTRKARRASDSPAAHLLARAGLTARGVIYILVVVVAV